MAILLTTNRELRKIIRETLLLEYPFDGSANDFQDAVEIGTSQMAAGMHGATEAERDAAQKFMDLHIGTGEWIGSVVDFLKKVGGGWNKSFGGLIIKIPGLPGAENYDWSDAMLDAFLLVAGGGIASGAMALVGKAGIAGMKAQLAVGALYYGASAKAGGAVAKQALQMSLKSIGQAPTNSAVKGFITAIKDTSEGNIPVEITKQEFKEAVRIVKEKGQPITNDSSEIDALAAAANEKFGISV